MRAETLGLPTNHDNKRQQPFEHKLDIKECTQPHNHYTLFILFFLLHIICICRLSFSI